ncbi:hypothetical protein ACTTV5_001052 [Vibrio parahaemolyticus]
MKSLPNEHIYSYLYRGYKVYGIPAFQTIINSDGLFKRRIATIKPDYVRPFILGCDDLREVSMGSGFIDSSLELGENYQTQYVGNLSVPPGLKMLPLKRKIQAHHIRYCPSCIKSFIKEYGCAYLIAEWVGNKDVCEKHECEIVTLEVSNRKQALQTLDKIFLGQFPESDTVCFTEVFSCGK